VFANVQLEDEDKRGNTFDNSEIEHGQINAPVYACQPNAEYPSEMT
jgi:hypothetical protein